MKRIIRGDFENNIIKKSNLIQTTIIAFEKKLFTSYCKLLNERGVFSFIFQGCPAALLDAVYQFRGSYDDTSPKENGTAVMVNGQSNDLFSSYVQITRPSYVTIPNINIHDGPWTIKYDVRLQKRDQKQYLLSNSHADGWAFISWVEGDGTVHMKLVQSTGIYISNILCDDFK